MPVGHGHYVCILKIVNKSNKKSIKTSNNFNTIQMKLEIVLKSTDISALASYIHLSAI